MPSCASVDARLSRRSTTETRRIRKKGQVPDRRGLYPRLVISAPRPSERPKLGHDLRLIVETVSREPHRTPTATHLKLKHNLNFDVRTGKVDKIEFEGSTIRVLPGFGVFITMNPGYAGRSALPDSLSALFRPVAMMVPDYALIGEIMFFAYGFANGKECGQKMVTTFRLCSEQCSSQPHYDYGMRAVKTVITAAGNLKRKEPQADELVLLLRALQDVNIPKFLDGDLPLFRGIISDLFPGKKRPELDYGALVSVMQQTIDNHGLQPHPWFMGKVVELYEMIVVRCAAASFALVSIRRGRG